MQEAPESPNGVCMQALADENEERYAPLRLSIAP
jgi:hypothetical protein